MGSGVEVSAKTATSADANIITSPARRANRKQFMVKGQMRPKAAAATGMHGDFSQQDREQHMGAGFEDFDIIYDYAVPGPTASRPAHPC